MYPPDPYPPVSLPLKFASRPVSVRVADLLECLRVGCVNQGSGAIDAGQAGTGVIERGHGSRRVVGRPVPEIKKREPSRDLGEGDEVGHMAGLEVPGP